MKIAHVITTIERGGAENQLLQLITQQCSKNWTIEIYPLKGELELEDKITELGAKINKRLYRKSLLRQFILVNSIGLQEFDIVHCHLPLAELLISFSRAKNVIVSRHYGGAFFPRSVNIVSRCLSRVATRKATTVIACSRFVKNYLEKSKEIRKALKIQVIHYGFVPSFDTENQAKTSDFNKSNFLIFGTLARLSPEKDLKTLINAISLLPKDFKKRMKLNIFGEGKQKNELQSLIDQLHLSSIVKLCGRTNFPMQAISSMDVFILTSKFEGFGMVLLESMSIGKPIICSRTETAEEVLGNEGCAIYFEPGNSMDLAHKILNFNELLNENYLNLQFNQMKNFTPAQTGKKIESVYKEVLIQLASNDSKSSKFFGFNYK